MQELDPYKQMHAV